MYGEKRNEYGILVGKSEKKICMTQTKREDNITMRVKQNGKAWNGLIWRRIGKRGCTV